MPAMAPSEAAPGRAAVLVVDREGPQGAGIWEGAVGEWKVGSAHGQSRPAVRGSGTVLVEVISNKLIEAGHILNIYNECFGQQRFHLVMSGSDGGPGGRPAEGHHPLGG